METKKLNHLFNCLERESYPFYLEKAVSTLRTEQTRTIFEDKIKGIISNLECNRPLSVRLSISNETSNDDTRYTDYTTKAYIPNNTSDLKRLVKRTTEQLFVCLENLIRGRENLEINSYWAINMHTSKKGEHGGSISIAYTILTRPDEMGLMEVKREYKYYLSFRSASEHYNF